MSLRYTFDHHYHGKWWSLSEMAADESVANTVEYDANENGVDAVTVFQTDRAEASSRISFCQATVSKFLPTG